MPAREIGEMLAGASETWTVSFANRLQDDTFTGTPTITASSANITLSNKIFNASQVTIENEIIAIGQAIQFRAAPTTAGEEITITMSCGTTAGDTLKDSCQLVIL